MIEISTENYSAFAAELREAIGDQEYFNGSVELDTEEFSARLVVTLVVYRRTETLPEGVRRPISNVVPVWWELTTTTEGVNALYDFSFSELKPYLIDHE